MIIPLKYRTITIEKIECYKKGGKKVHLNIGGEKIVMVKGDNLTMSQSVKVDFWDLFFLMLGLKVYKGIIKSE